MHAPLKPALCTVRCASHPEGGICKLVLNADVQRARSQDSNPMSKKSIAWVTLKAPASTRKAIDRLLARIAEGGWRKLGINRDDPVTIGALIEEGLRSLEAKIEPN